MSSSSPGGTMGQLEEYVEQLRQKLPVAPPGLLDGYVKYIPWLAMIFGGLGLLFSLLLLVAAPLLGGMAVMFGGAEGVSYGANLFFAVAVSIVANVLELGGGYMMMKRQATGWWLLAIALVVGALNNLLHISIIGLIITLAVAYIHIHVRPRYT